MTKFQPTNISQIKEIWEKEGFIFKKKLSQNFLIDLNIVNKILNAGNIKEGDTVLEIGPGSGALTVSLLERKAKVYAVEIDPIASKILKHHLGNNPLFTLINEDILTTDLSFLTHGCKVISNLPYHITSPIIARLAEYQQFFAEIIIMVQKEMAERILAEPPSSNRSSFSIFTSYFFNKKSLFKVSPSCFTPRPKIDSIILSLTPKKNLPLPDHNEFITFIRTIFSQKRKMISSIIKDKPIKEGLIKIKCNPKARAQELSLEESLKLYSFLYPESF